MGDSASCVMFQRFLAILSTTSSRVAPGTSGLSALDALDWNPNMPPMLSAIGQIRLRHASMPFSISESPAGGGPGRDSLGPSPSASDDAAGSRHSWTSGAVQSRSSPLARMSDAASFADASSGDTGVARYLARGNPARASEAIASRNHRQSCFRFIISATRTYNTAKATRTV